MSDKGDAEPEVVVLGLGWFPDQPGGANRYVRELITAYGPATRAVVVGPAGDAPASVVVVGSHAEPLPLRLVRYARAARAAARGTSVVDAHFALYALLPVVLGIARRRSLIVHFHGPWADEAAWAGSRGRIPHAARRLVERSVYRRADAVVTLSHAFADLLAESFGVDRRRIRVVPPGVDAERFRPGDRAVARRRLGIPADAWVVAVARRLVPRTGVEDIVRAANHLGGSGADRLVVVAGSGDQRAALEELARRTQAPVRFLGAISDADLVALYQAADVVVVPSRALEGYGLVVLEALSCGTPVVATSVGGLPEVVSDLGADLVVPPADPGALAERLERAARGEQPLPSPADCRAYALDHSWTRVAETHRAMVRALGKRASASPRHVVFVDHTALPSGGEIALVRLVGALGDAVAAHVVLFADGPIAEDLRRAGATVEILPVGERARAVERSHATPQRVPVAAVAESAVAVVRLALRLRVLRPDLVHANSLKSGMITAAATRIVRVPMVWHVRDRLASDYMPKRTARMLRRMLARFPAAVIANSATTAATLGEGCHAVVIPDPYDAPSAEPVVARPPGPLTIVMVGRLAPWKGQTVFLDAFARAFPDGGARAVVVGAALFGEDEFARSLEDRARDLGIADRVELTGFVADVAGRLATADVLVHASVVPEPHGQVVVEAMAAGLAVVATAAGGPAEIITPEVDGLLVPPGDADALAAALRRLADDLALCHRLGDAARRRARDYCGAVVAPRVELLYRDTLAGLRRPRPGTGR